MLRRLITFAYGYDDDDDDDDEVDDDDDQVAMQVDGYDGHKTSDFWQYLIQILRDHFQTTFRENARSDHFEYIVQIWQI